MAIIARLAGEGIGPFKSFDFDFSDAAGKPHPGPHIFAGINGSGKSTILRTLTWLLEVGVHDFAGFQWQEWQHLTQGYDVSRAMLVLFLPALDPIVAARTTDTREGWQNRLEEWISTLIQRDKNGVLSIRGQQLPACKNSIWVSKNSSLRSSKVPERPPDGYIRFGGPEDGHWHRRMMAAAYGPSRLLKHLPEINLSFQLKHFKRNSLSFEATVQNEAIQSWLLGLFSKMAIAKERGENRSRYSISLNRFESALKLMCDRDVKFTVDIEPSLQPKLVMYGKRLDFSQLPDGVRSTVGWLADLLMRMDMHPWLPETERGYVALLDEVDAHLHPRWQRSILPSIKRALPEVQVFATSHSPFVIASCPGARIHVLDLGTDGVAHNRAAEDAPVGESLLATIKDIFGVSSRFDVETERLLEEWNELHRAQAKGALSAKDKERMAELTRDLGSRSEELRQIVSPVISISDSLVASLKSQAQTGEQNQKKKNKRG